MRHIPSLGTLFASLLIAPLLVGCGDESGPPGETQPDPDPPSIFAVYGDGPDTGLFPFPSDRYTVPDPAAKTGIRVDIGAHNTGDTLLLGLPDTVAQLNARDGFSTVGGVAVGFTGPIDFRGIVTDPEAEPPVLDPVRDANDYTLADAPFLMIDVDEASPEKGKAHPLLPRWWAAAKDEYTLFDEYTLVAQPAAPLRPRNKYLFVVTSKLRAADGGTIGRTPQMEAVISGAESSAYAGEVRQALSTLKEGVGVAAEEVVLATVFTTASVHEEVLAAAEVARAADPPALVEPWTEETPLQPDGRMRLRAVFDTPEYRGADGKWHGDEGGAPTKQASVGLEVFMAFSDATTAKPRPVVIFAHGLGGTKDGCWGTADRLKDLNAAVISIDSPEHGSRSTTGEEQPFLTILRFFGVDAATQTFDIERARDNFRQMASDQLELVRFVSSLSTLDVLPPGAPDGIPDLDVSRISYIGHSFGSVQGPTVFALAPEIKHAVWNVGGAGLMTLLRDSATFGILVDSFRPAGTPDGAVGRFFAATQAIVDPGDPLNYARFGTLEGLPGVPGWEPRDVLLQEVVNDSIVPNSTSELVARAAGLVNMDPRVKVSGLAETSGPVTGNLGGGATGVLSQFDKVKDEESGEDQNASHGELIFTPEARAQYVKFFQTGLTNGHGTCEGPYSK